jgi:outer membrane protein TolC
MSSYRARPAGALAALTLSGLLWLPVAPVPLAAATLAETVDSALAAAEQGARVTATRELGAAVRRHGGGWIAEDPALRLKGLSDGMTDDTGAYELEAMVDTPLLLPGQRAARRGLGDSILERADTLERLLRWEMAGQVREAAWEAELADGRLRQAGAALESARALESAVARRTAAGELSRLDQMRAAQETLTRSADLTAAQAEYDMAIAAFVHLTDQPRLPEPLLEPDPWSGEIPPLPEDHPAVAGAAGLVSEARAERERVSADRRGHPVLSLGGKRARGDRDSDTIDALQLEVGIPFGLKGQSATALAGAERDLTDRLAELHLARREAEHDLEASVLARRGADSQLEAAEERAMLTEQALALARRAFDLGEGDLDDLLRAQERAREARLALALRRLERGRAVARLNQALGVIPQ